MTSISKTGIEVQLILVGHEPFTVDVQSISFPYHNSGECTVLLDNPLHYDNLISALCERSDVFLKLDSYKPMVGMVRRVLPFFEKTYTKLNVDIFFIHYADVEIN